MKFCAVICEYNPFHNGHAYQLKEIKKRSGCDKILCLMSGNFTQRGDIALFNKYERAEHAIENGADVVLELPAAFATSTAEAFASGGAHILTSLPAVEKLAFGCESGNVEDFMQAAKATLSEEKAFKAALKENMKDGTSYVKARTKTTLAFHPELNEELFTRPNNILGIEYARALLSRESSIKLLPIPRVGADFSDETLQKEFSSATAIRRCVESEDKKQQKMLKNNVPESVLYALRSYSPSCYPQAAVCALLSATAEKVNACPDCSEGLENRLRAMAKSNADYDDILEKVVSKRYTLSRLKRILLQNFLSITRADVKEFLNAPLYYKVLAIDKKDSVEILQTLSQGEFPTLARKSDFNALKKSAYDCMQIDIRANDLFNALTGTQTSEYETVFVR